MATDLFVLPVLKKREKNRPANIFTETNYEELTEVKFTRQAETAEMSTSVVCCFQGHNSRVNIGVGDKPALGHTHFKLKYKYRYRCGYLEH